MTILSVGDLIRPHAPLRQRAEAAPRVSNLSYKQHRTCILLVYSSDFMYTCDVFTMVVFPRARVCLSNGGEQWARAASGGGGGQPATRRERRSELHPRARSLSLPSRSPQPPPVRRSVPRQRRRACAPHGPALRAARRGGREGGRERGRRRSGRAMRNCIRRIHSFHTPSDCAHALALALTVRAIVTCDLCSQRRSLPSAAGSPHT